MISVPVIKSCPHTETGLGVIHIPHKVIGQLAGTVLDTIEWMVLLLGKRSTNGLTISVDEVFVPKQERNSVNCSLDKAVALNPSIVGVLHSHHSMFCSFSTTDDKELNPRFPMSIVISQVSTRDRDEAKLLGFDYKAEGRVPLPCGTIGVVPFKIMPSPVPDEWPVTVSVGFQELTSAQIQSLGGCTLTTTKSTGLKRRRDAKCGLSDVDTLYAAFGKSDGGLLKEIQANTVHSVPKQYGGVTVNDHRHGHRQYILPHGTPWDDDDGGYYYDGDGKLKHWGAYGGD